MMGIWAIILGVALLPLAYFLLQTPQRRPSRRSRAFGRHRGTVVFDLQARKADPEEQIALAFGQPRPQADTPAFRPLRRETDRTASAAQHGFGADDPVESFWVDKPQLQA